MLGGGIIGLAVAWRARQRGLSVPLLERDAPGTAPRTSRRACSPRSPRSSSATPARALHWRCARRGSGRASPTSCRSSRACLGFRRTGTLMVARDGDEARELERQLAFRESLGLALLRLRPWEARELEPALAPTVRLAMEAPDDHTSTRAWRSRAARACEPAGVQIERAGAGPRSARRPTGAGRGREHRARQARCGAGGARHRRLERPLEGLPPARACRSGRSRGRSCACATPPARGWCGARCASPAPTSCRAMTAAMCSARPSRSVASSSRPTPAGCTSCCARPTSWCRASASSTWRRCAWVATGHARQHADRRRAGARACLGHRPLSQRHPAGAAHRRPHRRSARRGGRGSAAAIRALRGRWEPARFARCGARHS